MKKFILTLDWSNSEWEPATTTVIGVFDDEELAINTWEELQERYCPRYWNIGFGLDAIELNSVQLPDWL